MTIGVEFDAINDDAGHSVRLSLSLSGSTEHHKKLWWINRRQANLCVGAYCSSFDGRCSTTVAKCPDLLHAGKAKGPGLPSMRSTFDLKGGGSTGIERSAQSSGSTRSIRKSNIGRARTTAR